jgi:RNA recognition motif-containing protein
MNIYVGNLDFSIKEDELKSLFGEYGEVSSVKVITDKFSGRSKGFAFVTMDNDEEAQAAINELNGTEFKGRNMVANEARPKKDDYNR